MTHRAIVATLLLDATLAVAGCATTTRIGIGTTSSRRHKVLFKRKSSGRALGFTTASLPNGTTYSGRYFQIASETSLDALGALWTGWGPEWRMYGWVDDDRGERDPGPQFLTHYTGRVVANLANADGAHMRCRFRLIDPAEGVAGGGSGACELSNGSPIHAQFPSA